MNYFNELGLSEALSKRVADAGLTDPTPIQAKAIPLVLEGRDVMGLAQTGTGKTAAFGLPLIDQLSRMGTKPDAQTCRALILAPTRELAKQISVSLEQFTRNTHMRVDLVVGGASIGAQIGRLRRGTDILVATPGRLLDILDRRALRLDQTKFLVLDEADQMLDLGFIHALRKIAGLLPKERQTLLFSATMPKLMADLAGTYLTNAARVQVNPPGKAADKITQSVHFVQKGDKPALLMDYLKKHPGELAIVFGRTKHGSEKLKKSLVAAGFAAVSVHGNKSQGQRERAISSFRSGQEQILVATDVAARGLDIPDVRHVYNFDLPNVPENYVHRIGRTARAGAEGKAVAFCAPDEMGELKQIQKVMKISIPVEGGTPWEGAEITAKPGRRGGGGGGGGRRFGGGGQGQKSGQKPKFGGGKAGAGAGAGGGNGGQGRQQRRRRSAA